MMAQARGGDGDIGGEWRGQWRERERWRCWEMDRWAFGSWSGRSHACFDLYCLVEYSLTPSSCWGGGEREERERKGGQGEGKRELDGVVNDVIERRDFGFGFRFLWREGEGGKGKEKEGRKEGRKRAICGTWLGLLSSRP